MSSVDFSSIIKGMYPKNGTFKTSLCRGHKDQDCPNKSCGFDHQLCKFFQFSSGCTNARCIYPHRKYSATDGTAVSAPVVVSRTSSTNSVVSSVSACAISVAHASAGGAVELGRTMSDSGLTLEQLAFLDECEEDDEEDDLEDEDDDCVPDENGVMISLSDYRDDIQTLVSKVLESCGLNNESAMAMCVQARREQDGVGEAGARFELTQIFAKNPLGLCEWVLTLQGWDRLVADKLYVDSMVESGHTEHGAKFVIGLFFKHWWGAEFGVYQTEENVEVVEGSSDA